MQYYVHVILFPIPFCEVYNLHGVINLHVHTLCCQLAQMTGTIYISDIPAMSLLLVQLSPVFCEVYNQATWCMHNQSTCTYIMLSISSDDGNYISDIPAMSLLLAQ